MDEYKSKSQKKRDAQALQKIGVALVDLSEDKLAKLPLSEPLRHAIFTAKKLRSHGAMRRQAQLIGKLMRVGDSEPLITAYENLLAEDKSQSAVFHEVERWRTRLLHEDNEALTAFITQYRPADIQMLRQLLKKAQEEIQSQQNHGASKALFRYLRTYIL